MPRQLIDAVDVPHHIGGAAATKPAPEIDNRFEEAGGKASPGPATKHANTLHSSLRLYFKGKIHLNVIHGSKTRLQEDYYQDSKSAHTPKLTQPMS